MGRKMEVDDKTSFTVDDKSNIVYNTSDFNDSFISIPLIWIEIQERNKLQTHIVEQGSKFNIQIADSSVRNLDIKGGKENKADIPKRVLPRKNRDKAIKMMCGRKRIRLKLCLPKRDDIEGSEIEEAFHLKKEWLQFQLPHLKLE